MRLERLLYSPLPPFDLVRGKRLGRRLWMTACDSGHVFHLAVTSHSSWTSLGWGARSHLDFSATAAPRFPLRSGFVQPFGQEILRNRRGWFPQSPLRRSPLPL